MVLPAVSTAAVSAAPLPAVAPTSSTERLAAFEDAMARQSAQPDAVVRPPVPTGVAEPEPVAPVSGVAEAGRTDALDRARAGFGLEQGAPGAGGDMILEGMQKLRGVFDASQGRVGDILSKGGTDASSLMQMQLELTNFTLLVDLSSKLTGKTTQVFDTLMKGQ